MMNNQLVTILSPCYNVENLLPDCLDSIISQTYSNLQIVLVDDGSQDGTWRILQEYAEKDSRVEAYHQDNQGVAATRNVLLSKVKGDYALFVDSDDWTEPDMVEFLVKKSEESKADVVSCGNVINSYPVTEEYSEQLYSREEAIREFLYHTKVRGQLWNKLIKTEVLDGLKFDSSVSYGEDALMCWDIFKRLNSFLYTDRTLYHYRMVDSSLSHEVFGEKKLSGHFVWEKICEDVKVNYPKFIDIAQARHCIEDTLLLRDAARCGYREKDNVRMLQTTIKNHWHCLNKVSITSLKMKIYAYLAARIYSLAEKI